MEAAEATGQVPPHSPLVPVKRQTLSTVRFHASLVVGFAPRAWLGWTSVPQGDSASGRGGSFPLCGHRHVGKRNRAVPCWRPKAVNSPCTAAAAVTRRDRQGQDSGSQELRRSPPNHRMNVKQREVRAVRRPEGGCSQCFSVFPKICRSMYTPMTYNI